MLLLIVNVVLVLASMGQSACPTNEQFVLAYGDVMNIQSDNYPDNYNGNTNCRWLISGPEGSRVVVKMLDFNTESCCDKLTLGNGVDRIDDSSLIVEAGGQLPVNKAFSTTGAELWMDFTTDAETNHKGFNLEVIAYPAEGKKRFLHLNPHILKGVLKLAPYSGGCRPKC